MSRLPRLFSAIESNHWSPPRRPSVNDSSSHARAWSRSPRLVATIASRWIATEYACSCPAAVFEISSMRDASCSPSSMSPCHSARNPLPHKSRRAAPARGRPRARRRRSGSAGPRSSDRASASTARWPPTAAAHRPRPRSPAGARASRAGSRAPHRAARATRELPARAAPGARARRVRRSRPHDDPESARVRELVELFGRELANRLEHPVAVAGAAEEALVDQRGDRVDVGAADLLGASSVQPPANTRQAGEEVLLRRASAGRGSRRSSRAASAAAQVPTASRRRAEAAAARVVRAGPAARAPSRAQQPARSRAAGSRGAVQISATSPLAAKSELTAGGTLREELYRFLLAQRIDGDLPLTVDVQRLAARDEHRQMTDRTRSPRRRRRRRRADARSCRARAAGACRRPLPTACPSTRAA